MIYMIENDYFDLTNEGNNLSKIIIKPENQFNCRLVNNDGEIFKGFILSKTPKGNGITCCDCDFQRSDNDQKYQARLIFRKTDKDFLERNAKKGSDHIRIPFSNGVEGYRNFWKMIAFLYKFRETIDLGQFDTFFSITDKNKAEIIDKIIEANYEEDFLQKLVLNKSEILKNFSYASILQERVDAVNEFKQNIEKNIAESNWQKFFEQNDWIFAHGLQYKFLGILQKEGNVSPPTVGGKEQEILDFLMGDNFFTTLVELKKSSTPLFGTSKNRSGCWTLSNELNEAVSQLLEYKAKSILAKNESYDRNGKYFDQKNLDPECILIIGSYTELEKSSSDLEKKIKTETFELFRRNSKNIIILTYDELLKRAEKIIECFSKKNRIETQDPNETCYTDSFLINYQANQNLPF